MIDRAWTAFGVALTGTIATLLLCFLVATPLCTLGIPNPPSITSGTIVRVEPSDLLISMNRHGEWYIVDQSPLELENLLASRHYGRIVIKADRHARFGALFPVFRAARAHGVPIVLVSEAVTVLEQVARERRP